MPSSRAKPVPPKCFCLTKEKLFSPFLKVNILAGPGLGILVARRPLVAGTVENVAVPVRGRTSPDVGREETTGVGVLEVPNKDLVEDRGTPSIVRLESYSVLIYRAGKETTAAGMTSRQ